MSILENPLSSTHQDPFRIRCHHCRYRCRRSAVTTLLRCPGIRDGENKTYTLTKEGEKPVCRVVDRAAIARCMADMLADETLGANESLGITNGSA